MQVSFQPQIEAAAQRYGLDPRLLAAVAAQETGGPGSSSGRNIVGDGGHGHGIFQIDDRYHAFARSAAAMDPAANAEYAAKMISDNIKRFGSVHDALSAYNAGDPHATGTKTEWGDGRVLGYADSVMRHYDQLCGNDDQPAAEFARANEAEAGAQTNALFNALLSLGAPPSAPQNAPPTWAAQRGLDSTGHARDKTSDFTIIGGDE